jgi:hypothetical protein
MRLSSSFAAAVFLPPSLPLRPPRDPDAWPQIMAVADQQGDNAYILRGFLAKRVACVNVVFDDQSTPGEMDQTIYCGFNQVRAADWRH